MQVYKIKSYAKINISLGILSKLKSKIHKIESLFSFIDLHDEIFIKKINSKNHKIIFYGKFSKGIFKNNTISTLLKLLDKKLCGQKYLIKINKKIQFKNGDKFISIEPSKLSFDIDFELKYQNQIIGNQRNKKNVYEDDLTEIFESRTFCLYEDIEKIKKNGLAKGGSLENALVCDGDNWVNPPLRFNNEPIRHKILDLIGDLA